MVAVAQIISIFVAIFTVLLRKSEAGEDRPNYNIQITSFSAKECPDVDYLSKTRKVELVPEFSEAIRTDSADESGSGIQVQFGSTDPDSETTRTGLQFPSCYNLRLGIRVLKQLEDPELDILAESFSLGASLSCDSSEMQSLSAGCILSSKRADERSCRICNICHQLQRVDDEVLRKNTVVDLKTNCQSRCCTEASEKPYVISINNLCISDRDIVAAAEKSGSANYRALLEHMNVGKIKDTLRFRAELRDRYFAGDSFVGNLLSKSNNGVIPATTVGCFEMVANYEISSN